MADLFEQQLLEAQIDGVTIPISKRMVKGPARAGADNQFPFRDGGEIEDLGRLPYEIEIELPLFAGVDPSYWPGLWTRLRLLLEDPEKAGHHEYTDPELGPIPAWIGIASAEMDAERRDGVRVTLTVREDELDVGRPRVLPDRDPRGTASERARELDEALTDAGVTDEDLTDAWAAAGVPLTDEDLAGLDDDLGLLEHLATDFGDALEEGVYEADELAARLDTIRSRIDVVARLPAAQAAAASAIVQSSTRLAASVTDLAESAKTAVVPIVAYTVLAERSVYEVANDLYADVARADDILARNSIPHPLFIPAGTVLLVPAA